MVFKMHLLEKLFQFLGQLETMSVKLQNRPGQKKLT
ncbi:hypothetical protein P775_25310 [Puniceibacterium antarcticum]|uniref:Uncharacterized protein n=1 Tax=Puniceibacterium antarcticum TaxID=1206336 RepID=A0A2G8R4D3_9RHOB|nr:hypothetical protein P775_25310 [Puniceibacterium antarcticum]